MLEYEMNKQSERRGRFLIQEIEEEDDIIGSINPKILHASGLLEKVNVIASNNNVNLNNQHVSNCKRPKHSSIIIDSKIIHTTRTDSNYYETFSTFIYEENTKDWVDFNHIWKRFSKFHVDVVENDMEKIFHYFNNRIDYSDFFCTNNLNMLQEPANLLQKLKSEDKIENKFEGIYTKILKVNSHNDIHSFKNLEQVNTCLSSEVLLNNTSVYNECPKNIFPEENIKKRNRRKSLILTNFCCPSIVSPAVSPIHLHSNEFYFQKGEIDKRNHSKVVNLTPINKKWCLTESEFVSKKIKIYNFETIDKKNKEKKIEGKLKIVRNIQFSLTPKLKNYCTYEISYSTQVEVSSEIENYHKSNKNLDDSVLCRVCKNKVL